MYIFSDAAIEYIQARTDAKLYWIYAYALSDAY